MSLLDELTDDRIVRDDRLGWTRHTCHIVPEWWLDTERVASVPRLFLGGTSASELGQKRRWVDDPKFPVGWGELARAYIDRGFDGAQHRVKPGSMIARRRIPWRKEALAMVPLKPALYLSPDASRSGRLVIVDIDRAYWQIASAGTADMFFRVRGDQVSWLAGRVEWPRVPETFNGPDLGRAIVGMLGSRGIPWCRYGAWSHPKGDRCPGRCSGPHDVPGGLLGPDLVGMVAWTMHAVASEAVEMFGARMWMTDAAVLPAENVDAYRLHLQARWNLTSRVVHAGPTTIFGLNRYRCGDHETRDVAGGFTQFTGPYDNLLVCPPAVRDQLADLRYKLLCRAREEPPWL